MKASNSSSVKSRQQRAQPPAAAPRCARRARSATRPPDITSAARVIELAQQRRLPAVPDLGADGADVGDGQDQQQLQPLRRLHLLGETRGWSAGSSMSRLKAVLLISRCQRTSQATVSVSSAVRPRRGPSFCAIFCAQLGMVAAAALGDVVQQHGEIERAARDRWSASSRGGERQLVLELALLDLVQDADGEERVLVHRVDMVHVVLHLRDDAAEIGDEAAEDAGLVHAPQRRSPDPCARSGSP